MLRKNILIFIKRNTLISAFFIISIVIITSYYLTLDLPELFRGAEQWFNLLFQLSVGYIINFMFYITQVYVPNNKRDSIARRNVSMRLKQIIKNMRNSLSSLAEIYLDGHTGTDYTAEELSSLLQLRFSDKVKVLNANRTRIPAYPHSGNGNLCGIHRTVKKRNHKSHSCGYQLSCGIYSVSVLYCLCPKLYQQNQ